MKKLLCIAVATLFATTFFAQKQVQHDAQTWFGYMNQTRLTDKWGLWLDLHLRTKEDFVNDFSAGIIRLGLTYYLNDDAKLTAGYCFVNFFPADAHPDVSQPEHRPWQQIQWHTKYPKLRVMQYLRLEERYRRKLLNGELTDGHSFNYRLRYNFMLMFPLGKKPFQPKSLSFLFNDELHINFGEEIVFNTFDQNRFVASFNYHLTAHDNLQLGYLNVYQQLASGSKYRSIHAVRLFYAHALDWRKKDAAKQ
ncbi:MAG: DUF2490 domain-containing protein [Saprospiraceae bacterium]|nr:DUF2490 domain-containing protein [Saprospiraceae bacterium]